MTDQIIQRPLKDTRTRMVQSKQQDDSILGNTDSRAERE
jgi:hypothetical protein